MIAKIRPLCFTNRSSRAITPHAASPAARTTTTIDSGVMVMAAAPEPTVRSTPAMGTAITQTMSGAAMAAAMVATLPRRRRRAGAYCVVISSM